MSNEDDSSEDRLTKNEFAELIQHLSMQEILTIEYSVGTVWAKLFSRKNVLFDCNLCVVETSCFKNLLDHINGRRHKMEMERVKQLYHPDYTYPKNGKAESTEISNSKNNENSLSNASMSLDIGCKSRPEKAENNASVKNKSNDIKNRNIEMGSTISHNKEATNVKNRKCDENLETSKESNKEQHKDNDVIIVDDVMLPTKDKDQQKKISNLSSVNASLRKEINKNCENSKNISDKEVGDENCQTGLKKNTSDTDRKINNECILKKNKLVINPAAALALQKNCSDVKKNEINDKEKPKYQTDKIIIPTVHKNKKNDEKNSPTHKSQSHSNDLPKFSVKSYSSKSDDNDVYGILGVEYVIKILKHKNDLSPRYECGLCELVFDGFVMQRHLEGYNHRLKFCEKHFPTAIRHYRQYMQTVPEYEQFKVMAPVLEKLSMAIEKHHGRNLPYECYERDFIMNRQEILAKAFSCRHASEQYGPTFTHVISANEIDEYIRERHNYVPISTSRAAIFDSNSDNSRIRSEPMRHQSIRTVDKNSLTRDKNRCRHVGREVTNDSLKHTDNSYKSYMSSGLYDDFNPPQKFYDQSNINVTQQVDDETYNLMVDDFLKGTLFRECRKRSASPSGKFNSKRRKSLSPLRDNDIWQAYRHMVDQELNKLDEKYKQYRKDLETHPSYNDEWQKFWKRRKDELKLTGLDHRNYNYQPEWVKFIKIRTEEIYNQEVENIIINCRERLCLPMTNNSSLDVKYHVRGSKFSSESRNLSPTVTKTSTEGLANNFTTVTPGKVNTSTPQVVSVLRLMIALEDSLGSLGPKIIDLLSKALQAEKTNPTQVNSLILSTENCSLIETAKEKFKGLLITGLYESSKEKVLKQVINDAEQLLKYAYQNRQFLSQRPYDDNSMQRTQSCATLTKQSQIEGSSHLLNRNQKSVSSPLAATLLTRMDKNELASKLAASLVAQGKTDFEPQQLQKIISVYNIIEKRKLRSALSLSTKETESINKKKLSDTLSDLLKSSSTAIPNKINVHQQKLDDRYLSSNANIVHQTNFGKSNAPTASFNSISQNSCDNYLINSAYPQLTSNAYGVNSRGAQYSDCSTNYTGNQIPYQQNTAYYRNDLHQNNSGITQSWDFNSNAQMNSNYNMSGPSNYNQRTNWSNF